MPKKFLKDTQSLGADVRALRKARKMTLTELAEAVNRSVGWLSQVERDISKPSLEEMKAIADQLSAPISIFFGNAVGPEEERGLIVRSAGRRQIGNPDSGLIEELISPDLTDDFEMLRSVFKAGAGLRDFVERPTCEVGYVTKGRLRIWIGDDAFGVAEGDSFRINKVKFKWENPYDEDAVVIWGISPPIY